MIDKIWAFFIIISFFFAVVSGNLENANLSIFESISDTTELIISMFGSMCFWCGIIKIISETSLQENLKKIINPIIKKIFNNLNVNSKAYKLICMNLITNMLGIGGAATSLGLQAMDELEKNNEDNEKLSDEMIMFIAINTASLQIIPTNVISIRCSLNSNNPTKMVFGVWFASGMTFLTIIILAKLYIKMRKKCEISSVS